MSWNALTDDDAARVSRWASLGSDNASDAWGSNNLSGTVSYATGNAGVPGKAFSYSLISNTLTATVSALGSTARTFVAWIKISDVEGWIFSLDNGTLGSTGERWTVKNQSGDLRIEVQNGAYSASSLADINDDAWHLVGVTFSGTTLAGHVMYVDASSVSATGTTSINSTGTTVRVGNGFSLSAATAVSGLVQDARLYSRALSSDEIAEIYAGPEPTYTSGASLSDVGAWNVGTWDAYSNGSLTYSVAAAEADGTPVDTGSGATGTLDLSSAAGTLVYLYVRASNNGGYDVGDFATRTGAYGSADDGYYEVASVTAAGGGGGSTIPRGLSCIDSVYGATAGQVLIEA